MSREPVMVPCPACEGSGTTVRRIHEEAAPVPRVRGQRGY